MPQPHATLPVGTFVYDREAPWDALRSGVISAMPDGSCGVRFAARSRDELKEPRPVVALDQYTNRVRPNVLIHEIRGGTRAQNPYLAISAAVVCLLENAPRRTLDLEKLRTALVAELGTEAGRVDDTIRMMAAMGSVSVRIVRGRPQVTFSDLIEHGNQRRDYLSSFTNELMAKSRRIDLLVGHPGTVGSYREELLRGLLNQLLPRRYEAITGFVEGCPRQLDIIVWDVLNFSPLFREQDFVVVPLAAVRAVIEVKTTLSSRALKEGMEI